MKRKTRNSFAHLLAQATVPIAAVLILAQPSLAIVQAPRQTVCSWFDSEINGTSALAPTPESASNPWFESAVKSYFADPGQWTQFTNDLRTFEQRLGAEAPEVAGTLKAIEEILMDKRTTALTDKDCLNLAMQVMHHAADPRSVDQGYHNTCLENGIEKRTYIRTPMAAANLVKQVATTGRFVSTSGIEIRLNGLNDTSLTPDWEAKDYRVDKPATSAARSFASQIFQVTATKLWYHLHNITTVYVQLPQQSEKYPTGELLYDCSSGTCSVEAQAPLLPMDACHQVSYEITGVNEPNFTIAGKLLGYKSGPTVYEVGSSADFHNKLAKIIQDGAMPALIEVNLNNEPFSKEISSGYRTAGAWHLLVIDRYDVTTGLAEIYGSWGRNSDRLVNDGRAVFYRELYNAAINAAALEETPKLKLPAMPETTKKVPPVTHAKRPSTKSGAQSKAAK